MFMFQKLVTNNGLDLISECYDIKHPLVNYIPSEARRYII